MNENEIEGVVDQGIGRVESAAGALFGDAKAELEGKAKETSGAVEQTYGELKDKAQDVALQARARARDLHDSVEDFIRQRPLAAVGLGVGLGIAAGLLLTGRGRAIYLRP